MSITITDARWANPERTRAVVTTAERGAVLLKPERDEWRAFDRWIADGNAPSPYAPPVEAPSDATFRKLRGVVEGVSETDIPSDGALALRLVLDVAKELYARGAPTDSSAKFRALVARIDAAEKA